MKQRCTYGGFRGWHRWQCSNDAQKGSTYCGVHAPRVATGEVVYAAGIAWGGEAVIAELQVAKRGKKTVRLVKGHQATGFRVQVGKDEVFATREEAAQRLLAKCDGEVEAARADLSAAIRRQGVAAALRASPSSLCARRDSEGSRRFWDAVEKAAARVRSVASTEPERPKFTVCWSCRGRGLNMWNRYYSESCAQCGGTGGYYA